MYSRRLVRGSRPHAEERRRFHSPNALRCVSKHEGEPNRSFFILRDARTRVRICGTFSARALLRMRTTSAHSRALHTNSLSPSRGAFSAPEVCNFASLTPHEGWAERRESFGCSAEHPWGVPSVRHKTRVNALMTRHARRLRGALRPMTRDARLSTVAVLGSRGRASVSLGARRPTTASSCLADPCSELLAPRS